MAPFDRAHGEGELMTDRENAARFIRELSAPPDFHDAAMERLDLGDAAYGNRSFSRCVTELSDEICEELADVAVWSSILAARLENELSLCIREKAEERVAELQEISEVAGELWHRLKRSGP